MPELPDVEVYVEALRERLTGQPLTAVEIHTPFLLRTVEPPLQAVGGKTVRDVRRLGKRIVVALEDDLFLVLHLMIAGRLRWASGSVRPSRSRNALATVTLPSGVLTLTEAGTKKRASLHLVRGAGALAAFDRGGLEPLDATLADFAERLGRENHTIKRSLTDPRLFSGIGNAYSDEILHRARLSPVKLTSRLQGVSGSAAATLRLVPSQLALQLHSEAAGPRLLPAESVARVARRCSTATQRRTAPSACERAGR